MMREKLVMIAIFVSPSWHLELTTSDTLPGIASILCFRQGFWRNILFNCLAMFVSCGSMTRTCASPEGELTKYLQAWMPSNHVWSKFGSPTSPQFLYQAPPVVQQLTLPDFLFLPHLGHMGVLLDVVMGSSDANMWN